MAQKMIICDECGAINRVSLDETSKVAHCGKCQANLDLKQAVKTVRASKLEKIIKHSTLPVVVDIYADWCGPCQMYAPIFKKVSEKLTHKAQFYKIDSEVDPQFSASFNVRGIPTTLIFFNGKLHSSQSGLLNEAQLESIIP